MTSKLVYILFLFEIFLILIYNYLPKLINYFDKKDGTVLLDNGVFLDNRKTIGSSQVMQIPLTKLENQNSQIVFQRNYAFSMWIYLNAQPENFVSYSKETIIFDCGKGKPRISYFNDINDDTGKNKYIVYFTNSRRVGFETSLPLQKWNNFVFNYDSNKIDLFINGELAKTYSFNNDMPKFKASDLIVVGSDNGLDGAICNVRYYPNKLSLSHITTTYNLLMHKNPPVQGTDNS
jgi:hypothetical protein